MHVNLFHKSCSWREHRKDTPKFQNTKEKIQNSSRIPNQRTPGLFIYHASLHDNLHIAFQGNTRTLIHDLR